MQTVNLIEEWRQAKRRSVRETKLWSASLILGLAGLMMAFGLLALKIPHAAQERDKWMKRAERIVAASEETNTQQVLPVTLAMLESTRTQCTEFSLSFSAVTRLLPKSVSLQEVSLSRNPEMGLGVNLRGIVQGFEPIRVYADRLRQIGLFSDVTPLSVTRSEGEASGERSRFEIRITLPSSNSTDTGEIEEGKT